MQLCLRILLLMFSIILFSCSASIENDAGDEVFAVEIESDEEMVECEECGIGYKTELCPLCNVELTLSMNNVDMPRKG